MLTATSPTVQSTAPPSRTTSPAALSRLRVELTTVRGSGGSRDWWGGAPSSGNRAFDEYRSETLKRLEEESRKPASERRAPEFGTEKDFQLQQALNQLKGKPVLVSKTLVERKEEKKDN